jgi:glutathione synthase/RimK-type ligase-like ATP-grasp enzyme
MINRKPFLRRFSNSHVNLKNIGDDVDFRTRVSKIIGSDKFDNDNIVLILSRIHDVEADIIGFELAKRGINYLRINADYFPTEVCISLDLSSSNVTGNVHIHNTTLSINDIRLVWLRHFDLDAFQQMSDDPIDLKLVRTEWDTFVNSLSEIITCEWINEPSRVAKLNKISQLRLAHEVGFSFPKTIISNDPNYVNAFRMQHESIICKSLKHHYVESTPGVLHEVYAYRLRSIDHELSSIQYAPSIFQEYIDSSMEIRVTVVGDKVFSASLVNTRPFDDWHRMGMQTVELRPHHLPDEVKKQCITFLKLSQLTYGAFDFLLKSTGEYVFLELNPVGDWHWVQLQTGLPIAQAVLRQIMGAYVQQKEATDGAND